MELGFLGLGRHTKSPVKRFDTFPGFINHFSHICEGYAGKVLELLFAKKFRFTFG